MNYLLDTSAVVAILRDQPPLVRQRLRRALARGAGVLVPSIVLYELWHGVQRSARKKENAERVRAFLAGNVQVVSFDEEDAVIAGEIRAALESTGNSIGPYDLLIAAQALRRDLVLVTANVAEFARVPGLSWQNWSQKSR
ncbi:MAG TPA: type II toxin-antitoxin system VapC family toxin [Acidobacteriaceae bacterium]|nr:type II toxin-antitoxin system VapC family toxin [Acidobacteriaceae bacterium]